MNACAIDIAISSVCLSIVTRLWGVALVQRYFWGPRL